MKITKYYNNVLKVYKEQDISESEVLRFINTTKRNFTIFLSQLKKELNKESVNFDETEIEILLKKLLRQRISYYNDISKPVTENINTNKMKRPNILTPAQFHIINEAVGINTFEKEIKWVDNILQSEDSHEKFEKDLKSATDGKKTYIKSIALDHAGEKKWSTKYSNKAEELGFEIKDNEMHNDIKRLISGTTKDGYSFKQRHINTGEKEVGQLPYMKNMEGDFQTGKEESKTKSKKKNENKEDLESFVIPTWAMSYIVNNDPSGLDDEEIQKVDNFITKLSMKYGNGHLMLGDSEGEDNLGFLYRNDIDNMGVDCERMYLRPSKA